MMSSLVTRVNVSVWRKDATNYRTVETILMSLGARFLNLDTVTTKEFLQFLK